MGKKVLLLGKSGKVGTAVAEIFREGYEVIGKNSQDFDALNFDQVRALVEEVNPDIVINTVAYLGIDPCDKDPQGAFMLNTLYPKVLAEQSKEQGFLLVHFSTDAVFDDEKKDFYVESDPANPLHIYGLTKFGGDCCITSLAEKYYIIRVSLLFGETPKNNQFVEKMLQKVQEGQDTLRISSDIFASPTYSKDIARKVKDIIEEEKAFGSYHVTNEGRASLYDVMAEVVKNLELEVNVEKGSHNDFPSISRKNTDTPLTSEKIGNMRPWQEAIQEYCQNIKNTMSVSREG